MSGSGSNDQSTSARPNPADVRRLTGLALFALGLILLIGVVLIVRFSYATGVAYDALVKDPERNPPAGRVIVAPADGTVIYVREVADGVVPDIVKRGVSIPVDDHIKSEPLRRIERGYLIGIQMYVDGVHVNRVPVSGTVVRRTVFNGPHLDMKAARKAVILAELMPGWVTIKKLLGLAPYDLEGRADHVLKSARETLVFEDERGTPVYVVRIADYLMGKILTWVEEGQQVSTGERLGMITWGSQTDILFEATNGMHLEVGVGDRVLAGETVLATY